jgi:hypothetical protein
MEPIGVLTWPRPVWGYDEITWFAHQDKSYRAAF